MSRSTELGTVYLASDLRPGYAHSCELKFDTAGTVASVPLPIGTLGVGIYPRANDVRFGLDASPEPVSVVTEGDLSKAVMAPGAMAKANDWTRRRVPSDSTQHTLYVRSESGNTTVDIEVW